MRAFFNRAWWWYLRGGAVVGGSGTSGAPPVLAVGWVSTLNNWINAANLTRSSSTISILVPLSPANHLLLWVSDQLLADEGALTSITVENFPIDQLNIFTRNPRDLEFKGVPGKVRRSFNKISYGQIAPENRLTLGFQP